MDGRRRYRRVMLRRRCRRRRVARGGFSLIELLVALALFLCIAFLTASVVEAQRRALLTTMDDARARRVAAQAVDVVFAQLRGAAAADLTLAADSAIEFQLPVAEGVVCQSPAGAAVLLPPLGGAGTGARTRWRALPDADDLALFLNPADTAPSAWRVARVVAATLSADPALCPPAMGASPGYTSVGMAGEPRLEVQLDALPAGVAAGTLVRIQRRLRLVLYRSADGAGQLGVRRCPADPAAPCASAQPAVGPLLPPAAPPAAAGLRFAYLDSAGVPFGTPVGASELGRIALIGVAARAPGADGRAARQVAVEAWLALRGAP